MPGVCQEMGCEIVGLQETSVWRSDQSALLQAGHVVHSSGRPGGDGAGKKGQGGAGLGARKIICRAEVRSPEFISSRLLLKVTLELCGRARTVTFVVGHVPTDTEATGEKHAFWTALDRVVKGVSEHEQLFALMVANARTERRGEGGFGNEECRVLGAYGRDTLDDSGERLLAFSANHGLALLDIFFSRTKNATSHTFNRRGEKLLITTSRDNET